MDRPEPNFLGPNSLGPNSLGPNFPGPNSLDKYSPGTRRPGACAADR
jgi:hypothetical protein